MKEMFVVEIIECGEEVGRILIPESYKGSFWRRAEINCPCNYVLEEGGILSVQGRNCSCSCDCYHNSEELFEQCDFLGRELKLPAGSVVEFYERD